MVRTASFVLLALLVLAALPAAAQVAKPSITASGKGDEAAIRTAIAAQVAAWNRGEISAFMRSYEDSPSTTFIGSTVEHGYRPILQRYRRAYANRAQMGTLTFTDLAVRLLPDDRGGIEYAIVTGRFHLARVTHGAAKKDDGIFSLVWRKDPSGWRIILDHTS